MYRIIAEGTANSAHHADITERAKSQTIELLREVTDAPYGNFDAQTHEEHIAFVEEIIIGGLRNIYARNSPQSPKAKERYYASLSPRINDIAEIVSGNDIAEIGARTNRSPQQVAKQLGNTICLLTQASQETPMTFRSAYRKRYRNFNPDSYSGLLGVVKRTEPNDTSREPADSAHSVLPKSRTRTTRSKESGDSSSRDSIGQYLHKVTKTPLLSALEEVELSKRIEAGLVAEHTLSIYTGELNGREIAELEWLRQDGAAAKEHFYLANLRLVISLAFKYKPRESMSHADMIQEGNFGLDRAIKKFDYTKGYKFSTYATNWIKQSITRGLAMQADIIRKPVHVTEDLRSLWCAERTLEKEGIEATAEALAHELNQPLERIMDLLEWRKSPASLDTPLESNKRFGQGSTLMDLIADTTAVTASDQLINSSNRAILLELVDSLDERMADIILSRFGIYSGTTETLADIGKRHGLSSERVRQLEREALMRLRANADPDMIAG